MNVILYWLSQQVIWIAVICLVGAMGYVTSAIIAKRRRDMAQFTLEREIYHQRMSRAFLVTALFLALAATVFMVSINWDPTDAPTDSATPTPSSGLFTLTPGPSQVSASVTLTGTNPITESGAPVVVSAPDVSPPLAEEGQGGVPTPVPQELLQPNCPSPGAQLTSPVAGSDLSGTIEVVGTADTNAFSYYRFEVIFPGSNTPNFVAQIDEAVENGLLGRWDVSDPARYPPGGPYRFQLVVVDIYGNTLTCTIPVNIVSQQE